MFADRDRDTSEHRSASPRFAKKKTNKKNKRPTQFPCPSNRIPTFRSRTPINHPDLVHILFRCYVMHIDTRTCLSQLQAQTKRDFAAKYKRRTPNPAAVRQNSRSHRILVDKMIAIFWHRPTGLSLIKRHYHNFYSYLMSCRDELATRFKR